MPDFLSLIDSIAQRPGMYVGRCSLHLISAYLDGYDHALKELGHDVTPLDGWMRWVELRFLISHPGWHWTRILEHVCGGDRPAIDALPSLYREFLACRAALGVEGIEAELDRRLVAEYGRGWHEPPETATTPLSG
jgi:hypothetical protein